MRLNIAAAAVFMASPCLAGADADHLHWRSLAITSQAAQIASMGLSFYVITGSTLEAEAARPNQICGRVGLNAGILDASDAEIQTIIDKIAAIKKPDAVVTVSMIAETDSKAKEALGCK